MHELWARTVVEVVGREYPAAMHHASLGPADTDVTPRRLHPAFWGSFDWHSCVHMLASGVKLHKLVDDPSLTALLNQRLTADNIAAEAAYLREHPLYERPYGWAWALQLCKVTLGTPWEAAMAPLARQLEENITAWLGTQQLPVRHGVHSNSALALLLIIDAADALGLHKLRLLCDDTARTWFHNDHAYPHTWELSGHDFVPNGLAQAALMQRVLGEDFPAWLDCFFTPGALEFYATPLQVNDPEDGQQAHLLGLMLTRAWLLRAIGRSEGTQMLIDATVPHLTGTNFMATHWLITYALLAEEAAQEKK